MVFLEFFACEIIYIPGNHDPYSLFDPNNDISNNGLPKLTQHSTNIHKEVYNLAKGLNVFGFGGSLPAYFKEDFKEKTWEGFPYSSDEALAKDLLEGLQRKSKELEGSQTILMTHVGPNVSSTTIDSSKPDKKAYSGSGIMTDILKENKFHILVQLHGHTHWGLGQSYYNKIPIINPGPLAHGYFAILMLSKSDAGRWRMKSLENINLNSID